VASPPRAAGGGGGPSGAFGGGWWRGSDRRTAMVCSDMAQPAVTLPPALDAFVDDQVRTGAYRDRQAVITDAVELLRQRAAADEDDDAKLARLNVKLQEAIDSLDRGEGIEITDLDAYFDGVMKRVRAR